MKKICTFLIFFQVTILMFPDEYLIMTFNIRLDYSGDGIHVWENRKKGVKDLLQYYQPGIFGIQEGLPNQVHYLDSALTNYRYFGVGRDDGVEKGEFSAIFYDSTNFKLLHSSTFWLSENPDTPSVGWDAALPRICTYGRFLDKTNQKEFWAFNTHFDHVGIEARKMSVKLISKKIRELNHEKLPVILMGDFNLEPDSEPIQFLNGRFEDSFSATEKKQYGPKGTFHGFKDSIVTRRIDYIFLKGFKTLEHRHVDDRLPDNNFVSDHLPVLVKIGRTF